MKFAERLGKLIGERDLTARRLAEAASVPESAISMWLSGQRNMPKVEQIEKLAEALNVRPEFLVGWTEDNMTVVIGPGATLREQADEPESEIWKRRAKKAELDLHNLKSKIRVALEESETAKPPLVSSGKQSLAGRTATALLAGKKSDEKS